MGSPRVKVVHFTASVAFTLRLTENMPPPSIFFWSSLYFRCTIRRQRTSGLRVIQGLFQNKLFHSKRQNVITRNVPFHFRYTVFYVAICPLLGALIPVALNSDTFQNDVLVPLRSAYLYEWSKKSFRYNSAVLIRNPELEKKVSPARISPCPNINSTNH